MSHRFQKHYTLDEARALLPKVRGWIEKLQHVRQRLQSVDSRLSQMIEGGNDVGGPTVHEMARLLAELNEILEEFRSREIQIKDVERGLLDFPSIMNGREVFLCWEQDEEDIEYWHDLDTGYAGRERL